MFSSGKLTLTTDSRLRVNDFRALSLAFSGDKNDVCEHSVIDYLASFLHQHQLVHENTRTKQSAAELTSYTADTFAAKILAQHKLDQSLVDPFLGSLPENKWVAVADAFPLYQTHRKLVANKWSELHSPFYNFYGCAEAVGLLLGKLDLAFDEGKDSNRVISAIRRVSFVEESGDFSDASPPKLLPNFELIVSPRAPLQLLRYLSGIFTLKGLGKFAVDDACLSAFIEDGMKAKDIEKLLLKVTGSKIPPNILYWISSHCENVTAASLVSHYPVLYLHDPAQLPRVQQLCKDKIHKIIDDRLIVFEDSCRLTSLAAKLKKGSIKVEQISYNTDIRQLRKAAAKFNQEFDLTGKEVAGERE